MHKSVCTNLRSYLVSRYNYICQLVIISYPTPANTSHDLFRITLGTPVFRARRLHKITTICILGRARGWGGAAIWLMGVVLDTCLVVIDRGRLEVVPGQPTAEGWLLSSPLMAQLDPALAAAGTAQYRRRQ